MSQWCGMEPRIAPEIMDLIWREARKRQYERTYSQGTITKILRAVRVPRQLQEKYRSQKFRKLPLKDLNRYNEKWRTIQSTLTGKKLATPSYPVLSKMRAGFLRLQPVFERVRHTDKCKGGFKCHKQYGCRHNFINYNYVIVQLLKEVGGETEVQRWAHCFKQISAPKRRRLDRMWAKMQEQLEKEQAAAAARSQDPKFVRMLLPGRRLTPDEKQQGKLLSPPVTREDFRNQKSYLYPKKGEERGSRRKFLTRSFLRTFRLAQVSLCF